MMNLSRTCTAFSIVCLFMGQCHAQQASDPWTESLVRNAANAVKSSVVQIELIGGLDQVDGLSMGSGPTTGLVVDDQGHIVSSAFSLAGQPSSILVRLSSGDRLPATVVAQDHSRNIVLLKVAANSDLTPPTVVPKDEIFVGQAVMAVGKTIESDDVNVSTGIVSATDRIWGKAIQSDAKISPANFGGPLVDMRGRVLGVLVPLQPEGSNAAQAAQWYDSGIGFAIPLEDIRRKLGSLTQSGDLHEGKSGLKFESSMGYASPPVVAMCLAGSPAAKAGMQIGDRITRIDGQTIDRVVQIQHAMKPLYAGDRVEIRFERDGNEQTVEMILVEKLVRFQHPFIGILPGKDAADGVIVRQSTADTVRDGLQPGDRIVQVNETSIEDRSSLNRAIIQNSIGDQVDIVLVRNEQRLTVKIPLEPFDATVDWNQENDPSDFAGDQPIDLQTIKVPEFSNRCFAYVPDSDGGQAALLVWVPEAGKIDTRFEFQHWKQLCDRHHVILVIPESSEPDRWQITESEFIAKSVEQVIQDHQVDSWQVGIAGAGSGAAAAAITALQQRSTFRGFACVESGLPRTVSRATANPLQRQLVLFLGNESKDSLTQRIELDQRILKENGFPVGLVNQPAWSRQSIADVMIAWVKSLDRM